MMREKHWRAIFSFLAGLIAALTGLSVSAQETENIDAQLAGPSTGQPMDATFTPETPPADYTSTKASELVVDAAATIPPLISTEALSGRSAFSDFAMSPDGSRLAYRLARAKNSHIVVLDAQTLETLKTTKPHEYKRLEWFEWAGPDRLLVSIGTQTYRYGYEFLVSKLWLHSFEGKDAIALPPVEGVWDTRDLLHMADDGSFALLASQEDPTKYPGVHRFDLTSPGTVVQAVEPIEGVFLWYTDDAGFVRMGLGWDEEDTLQVYYRADASQEFTQIGALGQGEKSARYWSVVQIISGTDRGYVLEEGESGRVGIRLFDYSSASVVETFYEHPNWDIDRMWVDDDGQPLAAFYTDDRRQVVWFDEEYKALYAKLDKAIGTEETAIISRSRNEERMLVWGGDEADPGSVFVYSPEDGDTKKLGTYRPDLNKDHLARPIPITYLARDGLPIRSYLTLPKGRGARSLPLIILPHGGPYGIRDRLRYDDEVQFLANRGYAVLQPNFRGSGGYGDAHYEAGTGQIGRKMQDDLDDAMDWAISVGVADPNRVCVVGGSYGGYAALWSVIRSPKRYRCAASWAGVTDFKEMLNYDEEYLTREVGRRWKLKVKGEKRFNLDDISPVAFGENLSRPVLLAHGTSDKIVPFTQYQEFEIAANNAPVKVTKLVISGEGHSFSKQSSEQKWYDALDRFLAEHNPADQVGPDGKLKLKPEEVEESEEGFTKIDLPEGAE